MALAMTMRGCKRNPISFRRGAFEDLPCCFRSDDPWGPRRPFGVRGAPNLSRAARAKAVSESASCTQCPMIEGEGEGALHPASRARE